MAIQKTFSNKGVTVTDAYWFIRNCVWRQGQGLQVELAAFADEAHRNSEPYENCLETRNFFGVPYDKSGATKMEVAAYTYIKTLPEFAGATDI